eukprot:TRINITY_DN5404_c0_g2_i1.p1 TRINITY_DN5404_c0_g2~~TRINITY_DN5404_c0_g2_i1.p1  ORF type:complete len:351 (+),score=51.37 TRINITY_DN5404_c0_g2_i1:173-1225(+)
MAVNPNAGKVQSVLGLIEPESLGNTLMHEHIFIDYRAFYSEPADPDEKVLSTQPFKLENLHWVQYNYDRSLYNLLIDDEQVAISEVNDFRKHSGNTIVDVTTKGIGRDPQRLQHVAAQTGVNVIYGAGYYLDKVVGKDVENLTEKQLEDIIVNEVLVGIDGIKCGIIGEIGCSYPITENELKVLRAAGRAQLRTGCALSIHPGRCDRAPKEIIDILAAVGTNISRVIMGHIDRTIHNFELVLELAKTGCVLEYDLFGMEISHYPYKSDIAAMPNDFQRITWIHQLIAAGYRKNIVVSHDIYSKHRLLKNGGHGWSHLLKNIVPRMKKIGITEGEINDIFVETPKRLLTLI